MLSLFFVVGKTRRGQNNRSYTDEHQLYRGAVTTH